MNQPIYGRLQQTAKAGSYVTYGEIAALVGLDMENPGDRQKLAEMLDDINVHEHHMKRPMLTAVVWLSNEPTPGKGFFTCASQLGKYHENGAAQEDAFFVAELTAVYKHWKAV